MVDDPNRKTPRQFQCRDYLWDAFEQLSGELECSIDYLVNEAMRHYLRAQGRTGAGKAAGASPSMDNSRPSLTPPGAGPGVPNRGPTPMQRQTGIPPMPAARAPASPAAPVARQSLPHGMPAQNPGGIPPLVTPGRAPPAMPAMPTLPQRNSPMATPAAAPAPMRQQQQAPMMNPMNQQAVAQPRGAPVLYAVYADQEVPVTKEEFFIGRGQKMCDLVIRDTNISRQHARVVLHNGQYWMIDNHSTNGVEFRGAKIQQKPVDDGDVFTICGHDVHFTYR